VKLKKAKFIAKEREHLAYNYNFKFNSNTIYLKNNSSNITLTQEHQCKNLKLVRNKNATITNSRGTIRQNLFTKD
jgi:azurin